MLRKLTKSVPFLHTWRILLGNFWLPILWMSVAEPCWASPVVRWSNCFQFRQKSDVLPSGLSWYWGLFSSDISRTLHRAKNFCSVWNRRWFLFQFLLMSIQSTAEEKHFMTGEEWNLCTYESFPFAFKCFNDKRESSSCWCELWARLASLTYITVGFSIVFQLFRIEFFFLF